MSWLGVSLLAQKLPKLHPVISKVVVNKPISSNLFISKLVQKDKALLAI